MSELSAFLGYGVEADAPPLLLSISWPTCNGSENALADSICSDSPLNAEAAELWDKDIKEFTVKVKARHRDIDDD